MTKTRCRFLILLFIAAVTAVQAQDPRERVYNYPVKYTNAPLYKKPAVKGWAESRVEEKLTRGVALVTKGKGEVYVSWRLMKADPDNVAFNVYRSTNQKSWKKINGAPVRITTDFIDKGAPKGKELFYAVRPVINGKEGELSESGKLIANGLNYTSIPFQGNYVCQKVALADLNGDGVYDFIIKTPNQTVDPGVWRRSADTWKIEAYLSDGTFLWRKDLGWNIEQGVWYSPFVVYDLDGDGRAEVCVKTAPTDRDYRDADGRVQGLLRTHYGEDPSNVTAEYCSILDGMTGEEVDRVDWIAQDPSFGDYNRNNRHQMAIAYLDGKTPALLVNRGTYRRIVVDAYHFKNKKLSKVWRWDGDQENPVLRSQGAHTITCGDIDGDGKDEVIMGGFVIDDNGQALWSAGIGHPDKATVAHIDPSREGLQILYSAECWRDDDGISLWDAKTGDMIWKIGKRTQHIGSGVAADIDASTPGYECWGAEDKKAGEESRYMFTAKGERIGTDSDVPGDKAWIWWDADLLRETTGIPQSERTSGNGAISSASVMQKPTEGMPEWGSRGGNNYAIMKYKGDKPLTDGLQGAIVMVADLSGDWREEIVTVLPGELRIYSTTIPAKDRRITLMQDPLYRNYVASRSMGYDQPAQVSYYLGE